MLLDKEARLMSLRYVMLYSVQEYLTHSIVVALGEYFETISEAICVGEDAAKGITDCFPRTKCDFVILLLCYHIYLSHDANRNEKDVEQVKSSSTLKKGSRLRIRRIIT